MYKNWFVALLSVSLMILLFYSMFPDKIPSKLYNTGKILVSARLDPPADKFTNCLLDAQRALANLSLPWFLAFGTAIMYYRSNHFISDDIDIGIFIDDFKEMNISNTNFISTIRKYGFGLRSTYGNMTHGQGWTLLCPHSKLHFGIFVFYHGNPSKNETFAWWTASYNGPCNNMRYRKCRWWFSNFKPNTFQMYGQQFYIVPKQFLSEQYGPQWMVPRKYGYFQSLQFLPNLIDEH